MFSRLSKRLQSRFSGLLGDAGAKAEPSPLPPVTDLTSGLDDELNRIIKKAYVRMNADVWSRINDQLPLTIDLAFANVLSPAVRDLIGQQVVDITADTRERLANTIARGLADGSSPATIAGNLISQVDQWWGNSKGGVAHSRAMTIARTETAHAQSRGTIEAFRSSDVGFVEVLDSPDCGVDGHDDPDLADGQIWDLDKADQYDISHPNCVRAFAPVIDGATPDGEVAPVEDVPVEDVTAQSDLPQEVTDQIQSNYDNIFDPSVTVTEPPGFMGSAPVENAILGRWIQSAIASGQTLEEALAEGQATLQKTADAGVMKTRRSATSLGKILDDGRFKTQFETKKSAGIFDPSLRAQREKVMFGYADDLAAAERPVYGYLEGAGDASSLATDGYGGVIFTLDESVRSRTTVVWNDSLLAHEKPSALTHVLPSSWSSRFGSMPVVGGKGVPYTELQFHGGLSLNDVTAIKFDYRDPSAQLIEKLEKAGFKQKNATDPREWVRK